MPLPVADSITIHRHGDRIALYAPGMKSTVYLSPRLALSLAGHLADFVEDTIKAEFVDSKLSQVTIEEFSENSLTLARSVV